MEMVFHLAFSLILERRKLPRMMLFTSNIYSQWPVITSSIPEELLKTFKFPLKHKIKFSCIELAYFRIKNSPTTLTLLTLTNISR